MRPEPPPCRPPLAAGPGCAGAGAHRAGPQRTTTAVPPPALGRPPCPNSSLRRSPSPARSGQGPHLFQLGGVAGGLHGVRRIKGGPLKGHVQEVAPHRLALLGKALQVGGGRGGGAQRGGGQSEGAGGASGWRASLGRLCCSSYFCPRLPAEVPPRAQPRGELGQAGHVKNENQYQRRPPPPHTPPPPHLLLVVVGGALHLVLVDGDAHHVAAAAWAGGGHRAQAGGCTTSIRTATLRLTQRTQRGLMGSPGPPCRPFPPRT